MVEDWGKVAPVLAGTGMKTAEAVTFARGSIDRATHLRTPEAQRRLLADPRALCLPVSRGRPLIDFDDAVGLGWLAFDAPVFAPGAGEPVFLGLRDGEPRFARSIPDWPSDPTAVPEDGSETHPDLPGALRFCDLRGLLIALDPGDAGDAAMAKGVVGWHETHGFCARCGAKSEVADAGWKRACPVCAAQHFPRTDPVVIMLITHGNAVLLGRSASWPPAMYSLLAGFMEPGESIEAAVRRETFEEAGIPVGPVRYLASQPWPFPSSLMIGCRGEALAREIARDPDELEDARWVTREDVVAALAGQNPDLRPARRGSIARFLIEAWLADRLD